MYDFMAQVFIAISLLFAPPAVPAAEAPAPDMSRIISVMGPSSVAHACPVTADLAVTAGHVAQTRNPFGAHHLMAYRGQAENWVGFLDAEFASDYEDGGTLRRDSDSEPFPAPYEFALREPAVGERLWWMGFDWRKGKAAFARRVFSGKVQRTVAGNIIMDTATPGGSSGSCVLDASGKVVGVIAWGWDTEDGQEVAVVTGFWPPYFRGTNGNQ